ncbi:MAG: response regulator [Gemmatimonadetes bacterium]|nr:response regulator [Gemmatimonadota bacterium]
MHFPRSVSEEEARVEPVPAARGANGHETVLVVEDHPQVRRAVTSMLRRAGYALLEAGDGDEALAASAAHRGRIDLVVTDIVMPRMNGRVLAERLRAQRPDLRVIFMSGYTEDIVVHQGVLDSGVDFIQKPVTADVLLPRVRAVLDRPR